jgi:hypothetical protein
MAADEETATWKVQRLNGGGDSLRNNDSSKARADYEDAGCVRRDRRCFEWRRAELVLHGLGNLGWCALGGVAVIWSCEKNGSSDEHKQSCYGRRWRGQEIWDRR